MIQATGRNRRAGQIVTYEWVSTLSVRKMGLKRRQLGWTGDNGIHNSSLSLSSAPRTPASNNNYPRESILSTALNLTLNASSFGLINKTKRA